MTFEEAHAKLLRRLDLALQDLRDIHADPHHLNVKSAECTQAHTLLEIAEQDLFDLKNVWSDAISSRPQTRVGKGSR